MPVDLLNFSIKLSIGTRWNDRPRLSKVNASTFMLFSSAIAACAEDLARATKLAPIAAKVNFLARLVFLNDLLSFANPFSAAATPLFE